jgi:hypothetical protein
VHGKPESVRRRRAIPAWALGLSDGAAQSLHLAHEDDEELLLTLGAL